MNTENVMMIIKPDSIGMIDIYPVPIENNEIRCEDIYPNIGCDLVTLVPDDFSNKGFEIVADDEGLLKENFPVFPAKYCDNFYQNIYGAIAIVKIGTNEYGENTWVSMTAEEYEDLYQMVLTRYAEYDSYVDERMSG